MADMYEVKAKYCDNCRNQYSCHTLCPIVLSALWDLPCEKQLYDMCTRHQKKEVWRNNEHN